MSTEMKTLRPRGCCCARAGVESASAAARARARAGRRAMGMVGEVMRQRSGPPSRGGRRSAVRSARLAPCAEGTSRHLPVGPSGDDRPLELVAVDGEVVRDRHSPYRLLSVHVDTYFGLA